MKPLPSELKAVTALTTFKAVRLLFDGQEKYALRDQDGGIVGLIERDGPYFINESFTDALVAAKRGLRDGAAYKAYPSMAFGQLHYVLDTLPEKTSDFSEDSIIRAAQELANEAVDLVNQCKTKRGTELPPFPNEKVIN